MDATVSRKTEIYKNGSTEWKNEKDLGARWA